MTRRSVVSGLFYPESVGPYQANLRDLGLVSDSVSDGIPRNIATDTPLNIPDDSEPDNFVRGVMVPHASMDCCGTVSASAWRQIRVPARVIVIGPNHTGLGIQAAVARGQLFDTPVGRLVADIEMAQAVVSSGSAFAFDDSAHQEEHSIEAVVPFVQARNPEARLTAICLRSMSFSDCEKIAGALVDAIRTVSVDGKGVLIVASSDLNHSEPQHVCMRKDRMVLDRIEALDASGLFRAVVDHNISMCGMVPVVVMILAARALGARWAEVVGYGTSLDFTGDPSSVVGYGAVVVRKSCPRDRLRHFDGYGVLDKDSSA